MILNKKTFHLLKVGDKIQRVDPYFLGALVIEVYHGSLTASFDYRFADGSEHIWMLDSPPVDAWEWIDSFSEFSWIGIWMGDNDHASDNR